MGLLATITRALGLERKPTVDPNAPAGLSPAAAARARALPEGHAVHLELLPAEAGQGWLLQVREGPAEVPPHPSFGGLAVVATDATRDRLVGLTVDHADGRWRVKATVAVRARETPNPEGRLYLTDRRLSDRRLLFGPTDRPKARLVQRLLSRDDVHSVMVRDTTLTVEREPSSPWDAIDRAVGEAIREHVLLAVGPLSGEHVPRRDDPLEQAVLELLDARVRPALHADGGDIELVGIEDGVLTVHLVGACRSCPASTLTLQHGVRKTILDAFPGEIDDVVAV